MGYVSGFEYDVIISYAHDNNDPGRNDQGWVDDFYETLSLRLKHYLGTKPSIWRDKESHGPNQLVSRAIPACFESSAALICIVSPSYMSSDWCRREREAFLKAHAARPQTNGRHALPIFKVTLTDSKPEDHPSPLHDLTSYSFYDQKPENSSWTNQYELHDKNHLDQRFLKQTDRLAQKIVEMLKEAPPPPAPIEPGTAVYLAEAADDMAEERDALALELGQFSVPVLPRDMLPTDFTQLKTCVGEALKASRMSVHCIGSLYGRRVPSDTQTSKRSLARIQYDLAVENDVFRIVWIPSDFSVENLSPDQKEFLNTIEHGPASTSDQELLRGTREELKAYIRERLRHLHRDEENAAPGPVVFVSAHEDDIDRPEIKQIMHCCKERGYESWASLISNNAAEADAYENTYFRQANGVVIVYGSVDRSWVVQRAWKARQAIGKRKKSPLVATVVDSPPPPNEKPDLPFDSAHVPVLVARPGFDPALLEDFFRRMKPRRAR